MTFAVLNTDSSADKTILGTVWASEESQASALASALWSNQNQQQVVVRKMSDDREIPLQFSEL